MTSGKCGGGEQPRRDGRELLQDFLSHLEGVIGQGNQYSARCPAHDDKRASLSVSTGRDGRILLHCHAGCAVTDILDALGLKESDLFPSVTPEEAFGRPQKEPRKMVARYNYTDENGAFISQKTRFSDKSFTWSHKENGRWCRGRAGEPVLYNLPAVAGAECLYIVEGEKDVETMKVHGYPAVCGADGAGPGKWRPQFTEALRGKRVAVIQDNDDVGKAFAAETSNALHGVAESVRLLDLTRIWPELPEHGDTTDLVEHFGPDILKSVQKLAKETPEWTFGAFGGFETENQNQESGSFAPFAPFAPPNVSQLSGFPVDCLPLALSNYVRSVAENIQVPVDMPAVAALVVCALCVQGKFIINPKPGWVEPLNLYAVIVARPSERKSPTMKAITRYVYEYTKNENERRAPDIEAYQTQKSILNRSIESMMNKVGNKTKEPTLDEILEKKRELRELEEVRHLRLLADDVTPEAMTSLLADNGGRMAIVSSEGGLFEILSGMYSTKVNIDSFLKAYSGDYIQIDRKGRPSESIDHPALTILLFIQFVVLNAIMENDTFKGRGLLARFLYSIPQSSIGHRDHETPPISPFVEKDYEDLLHTLLSIPDPEKAGIIHLSDEAMAINRDFFYELEPRLVDDLEEIDDWAGKFHGQIMRIAGILHCCIHGEDAAAELVSGGTLQNAITIGRYFLDHAQAAFHLMGMGESQEVKDAKYILKRIDSTGQTEISKKELFDLCRKREGMERVEHMEPGLALLVDHGYLRTEKVKTGGRPTEKVVLNPEYLAQKAQKPQKPPTWKYDAEANAEFLD